jgi:hypothetical protein
MNDFHSTRDPTSVEFPATGSAPIRRILGMYLTQVARTDCGLLRSYLEGLAMWA